MITIIGKKILILKDKAPEKVGSIYLVTPSTDSGNIPPYAGTIVSIGTKCTDRFKLGMKVAYHWSGAQILNYNDVEYILVEEKIISGIIALNVILG